MKNYTLLRIFELNERDGVPEERSRKRAAIKEFEATIENCKSNATDNVILSKYVLLFERDNDLSFFADVLSICNKHKIPYEVLYFETDNNWKLFNNTKS